MALVIKAVGLFVGSGDLFEVFLPSIAMAAAGLSEYISAIGSFAWAYKLKCDTDAKSVLLKASVAEKAANTELLILRNVNVVKSKKNTLHSYYEGEKLTMMGTKGADIPAKLLRLACYCTGATPEGSVVSGALATRQKTEGVLPYALVRTLCEESREAIAKAGYVVTVDSVAKQLANLVKNSSGHWAYVGSDEYPYIAVGVTYESGMWYCDIAMARENTDNK